MNNFPSLFEINTRVWIRKFDTPGKRAGFADIPDIYWDDLSAKGIEYVWLMGIWKGCDSVISRYCFEEGLIRNYDRALKGWTVDDVIGSPYSIDCYEVNPNLGDFDSLFELKLKLNRKGLKLILDFVPNHFGAESNLIKTNPELFLPVSKEVFLNDPHTFYVPIIDGSGFFAHGRDPFFPAWQDTAQVNFFGREAREYLVNVLYNLTNLCDGVRCDMAMLGLNNVFKNTWSGVLSKSNIDSPETEFWKEAIDKIKKKRADFLFLAEAYWDLEWNLQQLGFDYTYDKKLTDRLKEHSIKGIVDHLTAETDYQKKLIRFLENHDEERAITVFGRDKSKAAAVVISTIQGMRFYYEGQFEGRRIKLPVQLGRQPEEQIQHGMSEFYNKLLSITSHEVFKKGRWSLLKPEASWGSNTTFNNMLAWSWIYRDQKRLVIINYSEQASTCRLKMDVRGYSEDFAITDLLNDQAYIRSSEEAFHTGLFVELKPYHAHIFSY